MAHKTEKGLFNNLKLNSFFCFHFIKFKFKNKECIKQEKLVQKNEQPTLVMPSSTLLLIEKSEESTEKIEKLTLTNLIDMTSKNTMSNSLKTGKGLSIFTIFDKTKVLPGINKFKIRIFKSNVYF